MKVQIDKDDARTGIVDRDGNLNSYGRQGFTIGIGGVTVHFEDEDDTADVAIKILDRLGLLPERR